MCGMTQYSIRLKRSAIRAQTTYFLHSTMPSVTCLQLIDISVICHVTYFQFLIWHAFLRSPGSTSTVAYNLVIIRNIGHRTLRKIWVSTFPVRSVHLRGKTLN